MIFERPPPLVSYIYTKTVEGKIFNNREVVDELGMNNGTVGMDCNWSLSAYKLI